MTSSGEWVPGDRITAKRLNAEQAESMRPRRETALGSGSTLVNETLANQSAHMRRTLMRLAIATEDFEIPEAATDLVPTAIDTVSSGLCQMVRLNRATGEYQEETQAFPFRSYDAIAESPSRVQGDIFYVVFNEDSKRWEVIASDPGAKRIKFTIAEVWCIDAYNEELYVMVDWTHYTGGCGKVPPGVDYDGLIQVYDDCILSYITAEDLIGRSGSATFFYSREEYGVPCSGRWIVDDVCGTPECGEGGAEPVVGCGTASWGWDEFSQTWNLNENNCAGNCEPQMPTSPPPDPDHTASLVTACAEGSGAQEVQGAAASSLVLTGFASTVTVSSVGCGTSNWGWDEFGQEWNLITNNCTGACTPQMPGAPPANPDVPSTQITNCA